MSQRFRPLVNAAIVAVFCASMCFAQAERGGISGSVVDASGASMAKARISATNQATGAVTRVETTEEGFYKIPYLPAGKYSLVMESDGFATYKVSDVPVLVGQITTIDATLKPGSLHEEVTVTANALAIEQVSSSLGYVTGATQIIELPSAAAPIRC